MSVSLHRQRSVYTLGKRARFVDAGRCRNRRFGGQNVSRVRKASGPELLGWRQVSGKGVFRRASIAAGQACRGHNSKVQDWKKLSETAYSLKADKSHSRSAKQEDIDCETIKRECTCSGAELISYDNPIYRSLTASLTGG